MDPAGQRFWIKKYECSDRYCTKCQPPVEYQKTCGVCEANSDCAGEWIKYASYSHVMQNVFDPYLMEYYRKPQCAGHPYKRIRTNTCYPYSYVHHNLNDNPLGLCGAGRVSRKFYKFERALGRHELRQLSDENAESVRVNVSIMVAVLSIVCLIGFVVGYLVYRKRKKSVESDRYLTQRKQTESVLNKL